MERTFKDYNEYRNYVIKRLDNLSIATLNLEIQCAQIQNDVAARGALAAVEHIRQETEKLLICIHEHGMDKLEKLK